MTTPVQPETPSYDATIYQLQTTDPCLGGPGGVLNTPLLSLANRTGWLKAQVLALQNANYAPLASPPFTGSPTVPTPPIGDNSQLIADTAFVQETVNGVVTVNCNGLTTVTLTQAQYGFAVIKLVGQISAQLRVNFPAQPGVWTVINATTSTGNTGQYNFPWGVTLALAGVASTLQVAQGASRVVYSDGNVLQPAVSDLSQTVFGQGLLQSPVGYQKLPSGLIMQWGQGPAIGTSASSVTVNLPTSFPTLGLFVLASDSGNSGYSYGAAFNSLSQIALYCNEYAVGTNGVVAQRQSFAVANWLALGC